MYCTVGQNMSSKRVTKGFLLLKSCRFHIFFKWQKLIIVCFAFIQKTTQISQMFRECIRRIGWRSNSCESWFRNGFCFTFRFILKHLLKYEHTWKWNDTGDVNLWVITKLCPHPDLKLDFHSDFEWLIMQTLFYFISVKGCSRSLNRYSCEVEIKWWNSCFSHREKETCLRVIGATNQVSVDFKSRTFKIRIYISKEFHVYSNPFKNIVGVFTQRFSV